MKNQTIIAAALLAAAAGAASAQSAVIMYGIADAGFVPASFAKAVPPPARLTSSPAA